MPCWWRRRHSPTSTSPRASGRFRPLFTPRLDLSVFDPLTVRSFDVEDFAVPLVPDYVARPVQSGIFRVVLPGPFHWRADRFVSGEQFPFHGGFSLGCGG